ncbi:2-oxoglutarate (2OG) and Fe(II)-dependent oxygenase superfamily protein [Abeliophyllum distichum]|uniref:2-oxoglutarate (2OG) and Fe(II)-dependent oxygenase superfamily protein n=1 Tax=Abeliophyllum distichum TaxID=126358 RepID=A0ABD1VV98_9LAMI
MPTRNRLISSSPAVPPPLPPPIPTGKGSRSAANPILSKYIDKSIQIPELSLSEHVHSLKLHDIDYQLFISMNHGDSVSQLLRSARESGTFRIIGHGISSEELRSILVNHEQIFGLPIKCCTNYGDHERFMWCDADKEFMEKGKNVLGEQNFHIFR